MEVGWIDPIFRWIESENTNTSNMTPEKTLKFVKDLHKIMKKDYYKLSTVISFEKNPEFKVTYSPLPDHGSWADRLPPKSRTPLITLIFSVMMYIQTQTNYIYQAHSSLSSSSTPPSGSSNVVCCG